MNAAPFAYPELADALDICERLHLHIRDVGALASAIDRPAQVVFGTEAYVGIHSKGAALLDAINRSHPLLDGNKRLSVLLVMLLYRVNGFDLVIDPVEGDDFIRVVAGDVHPEMDRIVDWLEDRAVER
ncbi:type II toxin-antitoxin system death-on-curing family toxin [Cellulomonas hominis]|uniref:type II toxin-antitoxin system death-on-curing family toxin n=1 Tax=Cellulomonas hominis TaxID=156981 RepID=UPI001B9BC1DC|nr:Fic family protein [Cellulomonas hominis]VTR78240.1 Toxin Doc [Cellulomonas hominis]